MAPVQTVYGNTLTTVPAIPIMHPAGNNFVLASISWPGTTLQSGPTGFSPVLQQPAVGSVTTWGTGVAWKFSNEATENLHWTLAGAQNVTLTGVMFAPANITPPPPVEAGYRVPVPRRGGP
jgi:hypothetical protein